MMGLMILAIEVMILINVGLFVMFVIGAILDALFA
jgi:hypothetical protein